MGVAGKNQKNGPRRRYELKVVYRKVSELKPDPRNARTHGEAQLAQLAKSIMEFGFTQPVLLRPNGMIGAGHGRVSAAALAGLKEVPTITIDLPENKWQDLRPGR